ncbi:MAG: aldehyde dehydrogenase family protein, partial [Bacteroidaceae bacterium]|nr:aldehyde dehydrogenase family protein [Bacteroidaceae bacterium]
MKLENTSKQEIKTIIEAQRAFFRSGETLSLKYRQRALCALSKALKQWESRIAEALWKDLHKSYEEAYMTELSIVLGEIDNHLHHLKLWMTPKPVGTPIKMMPSRSKIVAEPLGCTLIMAPWNYPVQLLLNPLVGAISSGCTAVLKPSPYVPHTSKVMEKMIKETFRPEYIAVVQGNREVNTA